MNKKNVQPLSQIEPHQSPRLVWEDVLGLLRQIPVKDERWDTFDHFLQEARSIAKQNEEIREHEKQKHQLAELLEQQKTMLASLASYFQLDSIDTGLMDSFSRTQVDQASQCLQELVFLYQKFDNLRNQPAPATRAERVQMGNALCEAEKGIESQYELLRSLLQVGLPITAELAETSITSGDAASSGIDPAVLAPDQEESLQPVYTSEEAFAAPKLDAPLIQPENEASAHIPHAEPTEMAFTR